jgi:hypothetical protein
MWVMGGKMKWDGVRRISIYLVYLYVFLGEGLGAIGRGIDWNLPTPGIGLGCSEAGELRFRWGNGAGPVFHVVKHAI